MVTINNCEFYGVRWDEESLQTVQTVAQGLLNLTELFKSQGITLDSLIKIIPGENEEVSFCDSLFMNQIKVDEYDYEDDF